MTVLFLALTVSDWLLLFSSATMGLAALTLSRQIFSFNFGSLTKGKEWVGFEEQRRQRLRAGDMVYRQFEPLVDQLAEWNKKRSAAQQNKLSVNKTRIPTRLERLGQNLVTAAEKLPWLPEEYLACRQIESVLAGLVGVVVGYQLFGNFITGSVIGVLTAIGYQYLMTALVAKRALQRRRVIRERLPFCLDLMALMMEAGASFPESLAAAVKENQEHPLGKELGEVLRDANLGRTRKEALLALQQRLQDDDISDLAFALIKGDELGTPLSQNLRSLASQMLLKRSQWAEQESSEAQVIIVFPGMLIMVACLLIIVTPFILQAVYAR